MSEVNMSETDEPVEYMLTTVDNPFNPFTRFNEWNVFDISMGYHTAAFLDRVTIMSNDISEPDQALAIQRAIDEIVEENISGMWRKVSRESANVLDMQRGL